MHQQLPLNHGLNLTISDSGSRAATTTPTLVLVHGWTCRRADWHPTMEALADNHHLIAIDLPGHGDSSTVSAPEWTVAALARVLAEAVTALQTGPLILVGHSMGGAVALETARLLKDSVSSVVLVDTFVIPYGDLQEDQARDIEQPFQDDFPSAIDELVENFTAPTISEQEKSRLKQTMGAADPEKMLPLWSDLLRWNPEPAFNDLAIPLHAINGDMIPEAARTRCQDRLTEWHLDGAGHFPQAEMPARFQETLKQVIGQIG